MTPGNYTDFAKAVFEKLQVMDKRLAKMEKQINEIYFDDEQQTSDAPEPSNSNLVQEVKQFGNKIPYNLISDVVDVEKFKEFLYFAKSNNSKLSDFELEYVDRADKNFGDIRLSSRHLQILKGVYNTLYNKPWPFKYKMGYMYKLEPYELVWEWFD